MKNKNQFIDGIYLSPTEMNKKFNEIGYKHLKLLTPSSCIVNLMQKEGEELVTKIARYDPEVFDWAERSLFMEKERLEKFSGYEKIPQIKKFYDFQNEAKSAGLIKGDSLISPYILEKEFVYGKIINPKTLTTSEQSQIEEIVRTFHKEGVSNLDIGESNFIRNKSRGIVMFDVGGNNNFTPFGFKQNKEFDLRALELMLN